MIRKAHLTLKSINMPIFKTGQNFVSRNKIKLVSLSIMSGCAHVQKHIKEREKDRYALFGYLIPCRLGLKMKTIWI